MKILIADDHPLICIALSEMMRGAFGDAAIESVGSGDELIARLEAERFDLLIADLEMPGVLKSVPLLQAIFRVQPALPTVVHTGHAQPSLALAALDLGARGYVLKTSGSQVVDAARAVLAGGTFVDAGLDIESARKHPWYQLTAGEREVLLALARGEPLQAIAIDSNRSYKTVAAHKYNALRKLGLRSNSELGSYLNSHGLDYLLNRGS
jgi:two-component system capsular synthesis response regulator RcsB